MNVAEAVEIVSRLGPYERVVRWHMDPFVHLLLTFYQENDWRKPSKRERREMRIRAVGIRRALRALAN